MIVINAYAFISSLWGSENMRILLADDDPKIHLIVKLWLQRNKHQVDSVNNGVEALEKIKQEKYDCLITDVNMPLMKGVDLIKAALPLENQPPLIILMTSRCDLGELKAEIDSAQVHLFNKPFSPASLAELIENLSTKQEEVSNVRS